MEKICLEGCNRHYTRVDFRRFCRDQVLLGKKRVEIWGAVPQLFIDHHGFQDAEKMKWILDEYDLVCSAFTPKTYRYNLGSGDSQVRAWSLSYFEECIKAAAALGAGKMLIYVPAVIRDGDWERAEEIFTENMENLAEYAADYRVSLAVGGSNAFAADLPEYRRLMEKIKNPSVKCFFETEILLFSKYTLREWLGELKEALVHIHFADANEMGSCKIGDGCLPMRQYLGEIMKSGYLGGLSPFFTEFSCEKNPVLISSEHERILRELLEEEL